MIYMIMLLSITISLLLVYSSTPIFMILLILSQSLNLMLMIILENQSSWFALILFLVFLGGLMILFSYITSLASNELFMKIVTYTDLLIILFTSLSLMFVMLYFFPSLISNTKNSSSNMVVMKIYEKSNFIISSLMMIYLLVVLITIVNMMNLYEGPMRSFSVLKNQFHY